MTDQVVHSINFMPTCPELAGIEYPSTFNGHELAQREGNRPIRVDDWTLVARCQGDWELYNPQEDRTDCLDLSSTRGLAP
ncbi:MAG: hypothetical protein KJ000_27815 [Pirellulaceae bacterium]|nr:hypothetical protein [Pirellulaceae bacterium]